MKDQNPIFLSSVVLDEGLNEDNSSGNYDTPPPSMVMAVPRLKYDIAALLPNFRNIADYCWYFDETSYF